MQLGMIGLGRMGANMVRRILRHGHEAVAFDVDDKAIAEIAGEGATPAHTLGELVEKLAAPRAIWIMVPASKVGDVLDELAPQLEAGDVVVDGGNSEWSHAIERAQVLARRDIHFVDVGTSGGVWGLEAGYCMMAGGAREALDHLAPILDALAPGLDAAPRTEGRSGDAAPEERGWLHCGPPGAGHFVKMVHNGIEYAQMAAYAEGFNLLRLAGAGLPDREPAGETAALRHPEHYRYEIDIPAIAELWRRGSVVRSWLLDLTAHALHEEPTLDGFEREVSDSGEGRWTVQAAVDVGAPATVLSAALFDRFASRERADFARRLLSAMRWEFGGHR